MVLTWGGRQIVALLKGVWPISKWGPPWVVCFNGIALKLFCEISVFFFFFFSSFQNSPCNLDLSFINHIALRTAKTLWSFGCSEFIRVKIDLDLFICFGKEKSLSYNKINMVALV